MANFTEKELLKALTELLKEYPLDKITVKEITEKCGVSRNTFYYHFHDVYELAARYFVLETERLIKIYQADENWEGGFIEGLNFLYDNKRMIEHVYKSVSRAELDSFLNEVVYRHAMIVIKEKVKDRSYSEKTLSLATDFYKNALIGAVLEWIEGNMKEKPEKLAALYSSVFEGTVESVFDSIERVVKS